MNAPQPIRFLPGQKVGRGRRFRIINLLGKGAMGEVYRADDLELGDRVALKFLPTARESDEGWLRRFRAEVQVARQVSHPNVCRVHDVDRHDGALFLTMECIEGEDLWRLLRRFGRDAEGRPIVPLPDHKAFDLARQLCAGVAAIHDRGILHRDLKPSNIIVDERGLARITDFGLAGFVGQILHKDEGTVPYMAPEQLAGSDVSARSDLYSLGLVIYELFTGRRAFEGDSRDELVHPKAAREDLGDDVAETIMRCLRPDPSERPGSARELATQLPEPPPPPDPNPFPPPEVLLVSEPQDHLPRRTAWTALAALVAGLLLTAGLAGSTHLTRFVDASPEVLAAKASETAAALGFDAAPAHAVHGFSFDPERFAAFERLTPERRRALRSGAMSPLGFWYRQAPARLHPLNRLAFAGYADPPATLPGTAGLVLDPRGRLRQLDALAPTAADSATPGGAPDWRPLFAAAGLEPAALDAVPPTVTPRVFADRRAAWRGSADALGRADEGAAPVRVEAAAYGATPVSARVSVTESAAPAAAPSWFTQWVRRLSSGAFGLSYLLFLAGAVYWARRNFHRRASDRGAALRLAVVAICLRMAIWLFGTRHSFDFEALRTFWAHLAEAAYYGGLAWILYTALEPLLRRDWPRRTSSWVRLMHGRWRDPKLGRDVLLGACFGVLALLVAQLWLLVSAWLGGGPPNPGDLTVVLLVKQSLIDLQLEALRGLSHAVVATIQAQTESMLIAFSGIFGYYLIRCLVRRRWLAKLAMLLLVGICMFNPAVGHTGQGLIAGGLAGGLWLTVLLRFGILPAMLTSAVAAMLVSVPLTLDPSAWYAPSALVALGTVLALGVYGFVVSLGGEPALGTSQAASSWNPSQRRSRLAASSAGDQRG
ncbi:MAG TPA: protein kinase [Thermoanaerobaculia bacterium]|nr:protein kinase [Thermoanaerobaculia bacterium]